MGQAAGGREESAIRGCASTRCEIASTGWGGGRRSLLVVYLASPTYGTFAHDVTFADA
jgi:hypothetical protein